MQMTTQEMEMSTTRRIRTAIRIFVAVLAFALSAPIAVNAEEQFAVDEQTLAAEDQVPALAPVAGPSWDEMSNYGSVEASRAANALAALPVVITTQVPSDVRWAPVRIWEQSLNPLVVAPMAWDATSPPRKQDR
jgi:hypothetical protein